jgi:hypothetical protein
MPPQDSQQSASQIPQNTPPPPAAPVSQVENLGSPVPPAGKGMKLAIWLIIVVLVVLGGGAWLFLSNQKKPKASQPVSTSSIPTPSALSVNTSLTPIPTPSCTPKNYKAANGIPLVSPCPDPTVANESLAKGQLLNVEGNGNELTPTFTVRGEWDMHWSFACTGNQSHNGFTVVVVQDHNQQVDQDSPLYTHGASGSGTTHYTYPGRFYLGTNTECSWHITVTE